MLSAGFRQGLHGNVDRDQKEPGEAQVCPNQCSQRHSEKPKKEAVDVVT